VEASSVYFYVGLCREPERERRQAEKAQRESLLGSVTVAREAGLG